RPGAGRRRHDRGRHDPQGRVLHRGAAWRRQAGTRDRRPRPPRAPARGPDQSRRRDGARPRRAAINPAASRSGMTSADIIAQTAAYEVGNYARLPVAFVRGKGAELWDAEGRRYLDLFAGVAVMSLGHCHPRVVEAIRRQAATLLHVSNHYHNEPVAELVRLL